MTKIFACCLQAACVRAAQGRRMDDLFSARHGGEVCTMRVYQIKEAVIRALAEKQAYEDLKIKKA